MYTFFRQRAEHYQHLAPPLLTTLGILGTFLGIAIGLVTFDVGDIDGSIPRLLEGLKTAFITSIVGIGLSIVVKLMHQIPRKQEGQAPIDVGPEDIYEQLVKQHTAMTAVGQQVVQLRSAIAGEGEASVVTQLQKLRTSLQDEIGDLKRSMVDEFRVFADKVSELGTKQLIQALQEIIEDFNRKLPEQFGENFARLDDSVKKMIDWQQEYKEQVHLLTEQFTRTVEGVQASEKALQQIQEHTGKIPEHVERQKTILGELEDEVVRLEELLKTYAQMREQASSAMPEIHGRIDEVLESMRESVKKASDHYEIMLGDSEMAHEQFLNSANTASEALTRGTEEISGQMTKGAEEVQRAAATTESYIKAAVEKLDDSFAQVGSKLEELTSRAFNEQNQAMQNLFAGLKKSLEDSAGEHERLINEGVRNLDARMQEELERAIQTLANNLAGVTGQFVEDYTILTSQMQQVLEQNRRMNR